MSTEHWKQVEQLFHTACGLPATQRQNFLSKACPDDALRAEVQELLDHEEKPLELTDHDGASSISDLLDEYKPSVFPTRAIGPYRIERQIGLGGMGIVYLASDDEGRRVAIKLIRRGLVFPQGLQTPNDRGVLTRFHNEHRVLERLDHPYIAKLLDGGTTEDHLPYLVMEYIDGVPIDRYCDEHMLDTSARLRLFRKVCAAVHYAHQNLVVHGDLKPHNILIASDGAPKLLDFGIAKLLDDSAGGTTATTVRPMTPEYASPEQVRGMRLTTSTDVYALGIVLCELLSGHRPYRVERRARHEIERAICEQEPEKPSTAVGRIEDKPESDGTVSTLTPEMVSYARNSQPERLRRELAGDLDTIVLMALRKEPHRRYASAQQLSEDIRRYLLGMTVVAQHDTFAYRATKFVRRHRIPVAAAVAIALSLVGGITAASINARDAQRAERRALQSAAEETLARVAAARAAEKARQVTAFLRNMLSAVQPQERGHRVTVVEVLDRASQRVDRDFADQPLVAAALHETLGDAYRAIGTIDRSTPHLERAVELYRAIEDGSPDVARATMLHALSLKDAGHYTDAQAQLNVALRLFEAQGNQAEWGACKSNMGQVQFLQGQLVAAERSHTAALTILRAANHPVNLAACLGNLANVELEAGQYKNAETHLREAIQIIQALPVEDHPHAAVLDMNRLSLELMRKGEYGSASDTQRTALGIMKNVFGENHPDVAVAVSNLAVMLEKLGNYPEALELNRQALGFARTRLGPEHPKVALRLNNLAMALYRQGLYVEAEARIREALALKEQIHGANHWQVAVSQSVLGRIRHARGDHADAEKQYRRALELAAQVMPPGHLFPTAVTLRLGMVLSETGQHDEGGKRIRQGLEGRRSALSPPHPDIAEALWALGVHQARIGQLEDAARNIRDGITMDLARLPADHPDVARGQLALGAVLLTSGTPTEAETMMTTGCSSYIERLGIEHPASQSCCTQVAELYDHLGTPDQAAAWRTRAQPVAQPAPDE